MSAIVIEHRFRGPPDSANGGYACAMAAQFVEGPAEVTLRAPPPLGRPLSVDRTGGTVRLRDEEAVVVEASPTAVVVDVPAPVTLDEAREAAARPAWLEPSVPDVLRVRARPHRRRRTQDLPRPVEGRELYAAPWVPDESLADPTGQVRPEFVWAVLDCPSGIVTELLGEVGLILLGRLAADLRRPLLAGAKYVAVAWPIGRPRT